jgi:hypothetical protein
MVVTSGGTGFAAWTNSSEPLFRGAGGGVMPYSSCADTARPGQLPATQPSVSRRRSFRGRQRGGRCPCQMGGASRKNRKWRGCSRKNRFTRKRRSQSGGAGFAVEPMDNMLGKVPVYDTTACQMPLAPGFQGGGVPPAATAQPTLTGGLLPTQIAFVKRSRRRQRGGAQQLCGSNIGIVDAGLAGSAMASTQPWTKGSGPVSLRRRRRQRGGSALVGSPIESMTQSISGSSQPASSLVYPATTAAYSFDLAGSKNFKDTYAAVAPMDGRVGPPAC